jgi:hypothetical protein
VPNAFAVGFDELNARLYCIRVVEGKSIGKINKICVYCRVKVKTFTESSYILAK